MCQYLPLIGYLNDQVLFQTHAIHCNGLYFFRMLICWGAYVVSDCWLSYSLPKWQNRLREMPSSKLSRSTPCLRIQECTQLIMFRMCVGKSCTDFFPGRFTFSEVLCIPLFNYPLCLSQIYYYILCFLDFSLKTRCISFVALWCWHFKNFCC